MKIRQEIWAPGMGWSTINHRGSLHQADVVFCHGNVGNNLSGALYREIKHAFPNAYILFTIPKNSEENKLYLTALCFEETSFSIFHFNQGSAYLQPINGVPAHQEITKNITKLLVCSALSVDAENRVVKELQKDYAFSKMEKSVTDSLNAVGLNQLPLASSAIGIAFHDHHLSIQSNTIITQETVGASSVAAQVIPMPVSLKFIESGDNNPAFIPVHYTFLLKR